ncbi:MAG TPA: hypothetical protein PKM43_02370 [Verrucomicrobiota bacterium]|nr:hypothetical protein [Verrucomicrobiota bacterium]HRZ35933.1 hypothetical protein [Candidatus Paceibacterota bacterium]
MNLTGLAQRAREGGLAFLLIGGHAVIAHGHPRNTFDLDVAEPQWRELFCRYGLPELHEEPHHIPTDRARPTLGALFVGSRARSAGGSPRR